MKIKTLFLALWTQLFVLTAYADITKNGDMFDVAEIGGVYYNLNGNEATVIARGDYQYSGAIVILSSFNYYGKTYAVTSIGRRAFFGCSNLTIVDIPNSIKSIGEGAFQGCSGLTSMDIPYSVTSIGGNAFKDCGKLTTIIIPQNVKSINDGVFQGCSGLTAIKIPESVTSIGSLAFSGCKSLTNIKIPENVTSIATSAFSNCYGMGEYHLLPTTPPTLANTNVFNNIQPDCKIYVPKGSLNAYQTASNWSNYASYMVEEE